MQQSYFQAAMKLHYHAMIDTLVKEQQLTALPMGYVILSALVTIPVKVQPSTVPRTVTVILTVEVKIVATVHM